MPKGLLPELTDGLRCEVSLLSGFVNNLLCGSEVHLIAGREQPSCGAKRVDDRRQALTEFVNESRYGVFGRRESRFGRNHDNVASVAAQLVGASGKRFRGMIRALRASRRPNDLIPLIGN
jgi:hypothetical protein